jgi:hypothetical protein
MKAIIAILFSVFVVSAFAQKVDTLNFYNSTYSIAKTDIIKVIKKDVPVYMLGSFVKKDPVRIDTVYEEVSKQEYETYLSREKQNEISRNVHEPYWLRAFSEKGVLFREALVWEYCLIGAYREYDPLTGKIAIIGGYKKVSQTEKEKGKCRLREGDWLYFKQDGSKEKIERYKDDILIETVTF